MRALLCLLVVALSGCAVVKPWERDRLGSPVMAFQVDPSAEGQLATVLEITEGSTFAASGPGSAGGGCGCH